MPIAGDSGFIFGSNKALVVTDVTVAHRVGHLTEVTVKFIADQLPAELMEKLRPGSVLSDFGVGDAATTKSTNIKVGGRKLCLD